VRLKEKVLVVEDSYTSRAGKVIVGKNINRNISMGDAYALYDPDREKAFIVRIASLKREGGPRTRSVNVGETVHITLGGLSDAFQVKNGMVLSRRKREIAETVIDVLTTIASYWP